MRLIVFALVLEKIDSVRAIPNLAFHFQIPRADFRHAFFYCSQIFGRERALIGKIIIKAVLYYRTNSHLRIGKQFFYRMRQQMRGRVADNFQPLRILFGHNFQLTVGLDAAGHIHQLAVHFACQGGASQSCANRCRDFTHRHRVFIPALRPVR